MKCFNNSGNHQALKILIAAEISNKNIDVEIINPDDSRLQKPKHLPVLELDNKSQVFSSNQASLYLWGPSDDLTNQWLEWESCQLLYALASFTENTKQINDSLTECLKFLDEQLKSSNYLTGTAFGVADCCVWTSLYPLYSDSKAKVLLSVYANVTKWSSNVSNLPQVQKALKSWKSSSNNENIEGLNCLSQMMLALNISAVQDSSSLLLNKLSQSKPKQSQKQNQNQKSSPTENQLSPGAQDDDLNSKSKDVSEEEIKLAEKSWFNENPIPLRKRVAPVLPQKDENNILVTSALPYVNNVPHLGNIIGCVLSADVFSRYCRLQNKNVLYVSGTDEYGTATETKALEENLTPKEICDKYFKIHKEVYEWFNIDFDHFGRTSTNEQTEIVQELFKQVHANGFTSTSAVEQLLCEKCDRFLADRFVEGECPKCHFDDARGDQCDGCGSLINATELIKPRCKVCRETPVVKESTQLFLELPKIEKKLNEWVSKTSEEWSHNARVICKAWLKDGLKPRCITRDLKWGIPVPLPGFENKVFYVWFDAPIGYMSLTQCYSKQYKSWWQTTNKVTLYQFMAKDNVPFHSIMFPATLFAANQNYTMVNHIMATEYLNYEDGKFSKSRGTGVFGNNAKETGIPADIFRFYLLYMRPESQDASFSWNDFAMKNNSELLNNLGNFINRALSFIDKNYNSTIPEINLTREEYLLIALINREIKAYNVVLQIAKFRDGVRHILNISRYCNQYMQNMKPWVLFKGTDEEKTQASTTLGLLCNVAYLLSLLLSPYMPDTSRNIQSQLGSSDKQFSLISNQLLFFLKPGHKIGKPEPLFSKIEQTLIDELKIKFGGKQEKDEKKNVTPAAAPSSTYNTVEELENAVTQQGNLVRQIKSSGVPKSDWQPHVDKLLSLKKQLEAMKKDGPPAVVPSSNSTDQVKILEESIAKQAEVVRKLKASGAEKSTWASDLEKLLSLKKQLEAIVGPPADSKKNSSSKKKNKK